jgi:chromate reductase, NAD(P)H dehydrogenase (quinone)
MSFHAVAISGSLRAASSNTGLIRLAQRVAPDDLTIDFDDPQSVIQQLPFYNEDLEADPPGAVLRWRELVADADALIIGMPEHNFSPSAVAKNAIDWLTRPPGQHTLQGKVITMMTSGGMGGGSRVQPPLALILGYLGNTIVEEPAVNVKMGQTRIAADGTTDDEITDLVRQKLDATLAALHAPAAAAAATEAEPKA